MQLDLKLSGHPTSTTIVCEAHTGKTGVCSLKATPKHREVEFGITKHKLRRVIRAELEPGSCTRGSVSSEDHVVEFISSI